MDANKLNNGLQVAQNACGLVAVTAWTGFSVYWIGSLMHDMWIERKERKEAKKAIDNKSELEAYKTATRCLINQNKELLDEAMARTEGAT